MTLYAPKINKRICTNMNDRKVTLRVLILLDHPALFSGLVNISNGLGKERGEKEAISLLL